MPQARDELRQKFMLEKGDDGIGMAEQIILKHGGKISAEGFIDIDTTNIDIELKEAIDFLIYEWDYAIKE